MDVIKEIKKCNVSYHVLGKTDRSAMPLGNGELCSSVWVNESGEICFYVSRSDALTEQDRTVKLGMMRVAFKPTPFVKGKYCQTLDVADGCVSFEGEGTKVWMCVDPESDQIVLSGEFENETEVIVSYENWRKKQFCFGNEFCNDSSVMESADIVKEKENGILFYHKNGENIIAETAKVEEVEEAIGLMPDELTDRIFGGYILLENGKIENKKLVKKEAHSFTLWIRTVSLQGSETEFQDGLFQWKNKKNFAEIKENSKMFWNSYWENSYIFVENDQPEKVTVEKKVLEKVEEPQESMVDSISQVTIAYVLTRFMIKCCQNGKYPILYNGMMFNLCPGENRHYETTTFGTVCTAIPGEITSENNPDERSWCVEHLWQNIRHPYHTFLAQGEPDAMKVLFRYYRRFWNINRFRAQKYYHAEGQHNTEMTMSFGLQSVGIYGIDRSGKPIGYAENRHGGAVDVSPGLELLALMLDYYDYADDSQFFKEEIQVYAKDLFRYIETRFTQRIDGKLVMEPLQSVETYWDTRNPVTVVSGMWSVSKRLLNSKDLDKELREYFENYQRQIPEICCREEEGEIVLQPAEKYGEERHNVEIPELYACFPFNLYNQFSNDAELMKRTFKKRLKEYGGTRYFEIGGHTYIPSYSGWQYHGIVAARLGMTEMAKDILTHNVQLKNPGTRFPAMWGPIYDGVPDTDHGANIIHLLQEMVMQVDGENIYLLPAFPKEWNVCFKLHPNINTTICVEYKSGSLRKIEVYPEKAKERVIFK